jgi:molybdopterin-guanine dinucleotide biosynthesis protein A
VIIAGLVLCGGRSRRFGREKALAKLEGRPLISFPIEALRRGCASVAVSAPACSGAARWAGAHGLDVITDGAGCYGGPLFGVLAGLRWAVSQETDFLITTPCDLPCLPCDIAQRLSGGVAHERGVVAVDSGGVVQPLCAAWPPAALGALERALESGGHPAARDVVRDLGFQKLRFDEADAFINVNAPGDLLLAAAGLKNEKRRRPPGDALEDCGD